MLPRKIIDFQSALKIGNFVENDLLWILYI